MAALREVTVRVPNLARTIGRPEMEFPFGFAEPSLPHPDGGRATLTEPIASKRGTQETHPARRNHSE